jgi:hypothetical protein
MPASTRNLLTHTETKSFGSRSVDESTQQSNETRHHLLEDVTEPPVKVSEIPWSIHFTSPQSNVTSLCEDQISRSTQKTVRATSRSWA